MATSKNIKSVVICVLILGLVLEQVQAASITCCKTTEARRCYNICRLTPQACASTCGCKIIDSSKCPSDYPELHLLPGSAEPDAAQYCAIGCRTSVCDRMGNVFRGQETKIDMELCSNACVRFCNEGAVIPSVGA